jgi:apolipoprotein N-acyltransferase
VSSLAFDAGPTALRLLIDLAALAALCALSLRRHGRRDLVVLLALFNVGLFVAVVVIAAGRVDAAVGFGLFAVLSIIRLRSEPLAHPEIASFFAALVLALASAVDLGGPLGTVLLCALVLAAAAVVDHPRLLRGDHRVALTLEVVVTDHDELLALVRDRLGAGVAAVQVLEVDYVRELTRVVARVQGTARPRVGGQDEEVGGALLTLDR